MTFLRRIIVPVLTAALVVGSIAMPATAGRDYRTIVDIHFPVASSSVRYSNDFANGRSGGRIHRATDLFARMGAPVRAARGGTVIWLPREQSGSAGFAIQILGDDGRTYAYYHMGRDGGPYRRAISAQLAVGSTVERGQFLGWLGDSGNAAGGTPHLHFEIHDNAVQDPYGSNRVNPYASLRAAQGLPIGDRGPAADAPTTRSAVLRLGSRGPAVTDWQRQLNRTRPANPISTDGTFGPGTRRATVYFQRARAGLGPAGLGIVGPNTRAAMTRILARQASTPTPRPPAPRPPAPKPPAPRTPAPTTPAPTTTAPLLKVGSRGPAVVTWQRQLNRTRPANPISTDGAFGPGTRRATIYFQRAHGLGPAGLGVVGPKTRAAMAQALR